MRASVDARTLLLVLDRPGPLGATIVFAAVAAVVALLIPMYGATHTAELAGIPLGYGDQARYMRMADAPFRFLEVPYGYRMLMPLIVSLIPMDHPTGFMIVTTLAIAATAAFLHQYVALALGHRALFGVLLLIASPVVQFAAERPFIVDPLAYLFITLAFLLLARSSLVLLASALGIGLFAKEQVAYALAPAAAIATFGYRLRPLAAWTLVFLLPAAAYVAIHRTPLVFGETPPLETDIYFHPSIVSEILGYQQQWASVPQSLVSVLIFSFGALWVAVPLAFRHVPAVMRWSVVYLIPVVGSLLIIYDWKRMLFYAFPVVVPFACALSLRRLEAAALLASTAAITYLVVDMPASMPKYLVEVGLLVVGLACILRAWRRQAGYGPGPSVPATMTS